MNGKNSNGYLSEESFLDVIVDVSGLSRPDLQHFAGSGSIWELRLTRLALDSLALLELQLELEERMGLVIDLRRVVLTPETTLKDLFRAVSA